MRLEYVCLLFIFGSIKSFPFSFGVLLPLLFSESVSGVKRVPDEPGAGSNWNGISDKVLSRFSINAQIKLGDMWKATDIDNYPIKIK